MDWAKLRVRFVRSPGFALASDSAVAAWTRLVAHCADQENGGAIEFNPEWSTREWLTATGVTARGFQEAVRCGLAEVSGRTLRIAGYEAGAEDRVTASRLNGALGGRPPADESPPDPKPGGLPGPKPNGLTRAEKSREEQKAEGCAEVGKAASPPPGVLVEFPTAKGRKNGSEAWWLTRPMAAELASAFPGVDVEAEARKARVWVLANMSRRKTADGMLNFLQRWIGRAVNSGHVSRQARPAQVNGHSQLCDFHRDYRTTGKPSKYPKPATCSECKHVGLKARSHTEGEPTSLANVMGES